jgi:hypothetical protein
MSLENYLSVVPWQEFLDLQLLISLSGLGALVLE